MPITHHAVDALAGEVIAVREDFVFGGCFQVAGQDHPITLMPDFAVRDARQQQAVHPKVIDVFFQAQCFRAHT